MAKSRAARMGAAAGAVDALSKALAGLSESERMRWMVFLLEDLEAGEALDEVALAGLVDRIQQRLEAGGWE